ncbi:MAG: hypothetical protein O3A63_18635 [Proteobacteria bacterium]|nr:hypothetical protein [Pseudomonadota bacterium]
MSDQVIASDKPLTHAERRNLAAISDIMIPADITYGVPGAGDELIQNELLLILRTQHQAIINALTCLDELSSGAAGSFADLVPPERAEVAERFRRKRGDLAAVLVSLTLQVYYRDDRVLASLDMEPRAPYPQGYQVESGDWSLLDPVRAREPFYRKV